MDASCKQCGAVITADNGVIKDGYRRHICKACTAGKMREWATSNPERALFNAAKARAKRTGLEFTITLDDVVIPERCPVFETPFVLKDGETAGGTGMAPSLDRVDSRRGYVPGNVAVISSRANRIKNNATPEELQALASYASKQWTPSKS
ncbi:endonuclease [Ralstonia phage DU_RP_I]|uniref:Uncharacterized protein n=1 Tax=Ralstonia phage DU_RP_I TaxID=2041493 RepID=A0A2D2W502_9CAUD|nr:endonuclease [Ralstonia phage DU_RP_I]ATS93379.1 hypothetical protein R1B41kb_p018 [Ralstonia phage DU_RP_I]